MENSFADIQYCEELFNRFYDIGGLTSGGVTRLGYTQTEDQMHEMFALLGGELGYGNTQDEVGNTYVGSTARDGYYLIGSHLDSVIDGGRYDGVAGVIAGLMVLRWAREEGLPVPVRVGAFRCEESSNFGCCTIGSGLVTKELHRQRVAGHEFGFEHSLLTSSERVLEQMPSRFRLDHEEGFTVPWAFAGETARIGQPASKMTVPYSKYKTGYFAYDTDKKQYFISQSLDGSDPIDYVDGQTGEAVGVNNVLVLFTDVGLVKGDAAGRMSVRTTGTGDGLLLRDGVLQEITWQRDKRTDCLRFLDRASGQDTPLAFGPSYINIVGTSAQVTWE